MNSNIAAQGVPRCCDRQAEARHPCVGQARASFPFSTVNPAVHMLLSVRGNAHGAKKRLSRCLKNTGLLIVTAFSCGIAPSARNMMLMNETCNFVSSFQCDEHSCLVAVRLATACLPERRFAAVHTGGDRCLSWRVQGLRCQQSSTGGTYCSEAASVEGCDVQVKPERPNHQRDNDHLHSTQHVHAAPSGSEGLGSGTTCDLLPRLKQSDKHLMAGAWAHSPRPVQTGARADASAKHTAAASIGCMTAADMGGRTAERIICPTSAWSQPARGTGTGASRAQLEVATASCRLIHAQPGGRVGEHLDQAGAVHGALSEGELELSVAHNLEHVERGQREAVCEERALGPAAADPRRQILLDLEAMSVPLVELAAHLRAGHRALCTPTAIRCHMTLPWHPRQARQLALQGSLCCVRGVHRCHEERALDLKGCVVESAKSRQVCSPGEPPLGDEIMCICQSVLFPDADMGPRRNKSS